MNALSLGGVGIGNGGGMIDEASAPAEENVSVVGILFGERFENGQGFDVLLLIQKGHGKFSLSLVSIVGRCRSC